MIKNYNELTVIGMPHPTAQTGRGKGGRTAFDTLLKITDDERQLYRIINKINKLSSLPKGERHINLTTIPNIDSSLSI